MSTPPSEPWWPSPYGAEDELGTLNEITPTKVIAAARLVRTGTVYDLGRTLHADIPRFEGRFWHQTLVNSAHFINARRPGSDAGGWGRNRLNWIQEYFHGDTGAGVGASHQSGWTALVAKLLEQTRGK